DFGWDAPGSPVRVMSFSFTALQRVEKMAPGVRLVQLVEHSASWAMLRRVIGKDWVVGPGIDELREHPRFAQRVARSGHEIHVWTVNTPADLELCRSLGVTAVITDRPAYILEMLDR